MSLPKPSLPDNGCMYYWKSVVKLMRINEHF